MKHKLILAPLSVLIVAGGAGLIWMLGQSPPEVEVDVPVKKPQVARRTGPAPAPQPPRPGRAEPRQAATDQAPARAPREPRPGPPPPVRTTERPSFAVDRVELRREPRAEDEPPAYHVSRTNFIAAYDRFTEAVGGLPEDRERQLLTILADTQSNLDILEQDEQLLRQSAQGMAGEQLATERRSINERFVAIGQEANQRLEELLSEEEWDAWQQTLNRTPWGYWLLYGNPISAR